jgi:hypothetical protein
MAKKVAVLLSSVVLLLLASGVSWAVPTCTPLGFAGDCNILITFGAGGSIVTTFPFATPYDAGVNGDDQYVGVLNHSGHTLNSITLTGIDIFHFDDDGAFSGGTNCVGGGAAGPNPCGTGGGTTGGSGDNGYASSSVTFSAITRGSPDVGTVNFVGGLPDGGLTFFSLEAPASLNAIGITATPEPSTIWLLGTSVPTLLFWARARRKGPAGTEA